MKTRRNVMKLLAAVTVLTSLNTYAGVCNKGSLQGAYNFSGMGVSLGDSFHFVGRIFFNGTGSASIAGVNTASGTAFGINGRGTYYITSTCVASGSFNLNTGLTIT